jgi:hypothetical protein
MVTSAPSPLSPPRLCSWEGAAGDPMIQSTPSGLRRITVANLPIEVEVLSQKQAWAVYDRWLEDRRVILAEEPPVLERRFRALSKTLISGKRNDVVDAGIVQPYRAGAFRAQQRQPDVPPLRRVIRRQNLLRPLQHQRFDRPALSGCSCLQPPIHRVGNVDRRAHRSILRYLWLMRAAAT